MKQKTATILGKVMSLGLVTVFAGAVMLATGTKWGSRSNGDNGPTEQPASANFLSSPDTGLS